MGIPEVGTASAAPTPRSTSTSPAASAHAGAGRSSFADVFGGLAGQDAPDEPESRPEPSLRGDRPGGDSPRERTPRGVRGQRHHTSAVAGARTRVGGSSDAADAVEPEVPEGPPRSSAFAAESRDDDAVALDEDQEAASVGTDVVGDRQVAMLDRSGATPVPVDQVVASAGPVSPPIEEATWAQDQDPRPAVRLPEFPRRTTTDPTTESEGGETAAVSPGSPGAGQSLEPTAPHSVADAARATGPTADTPRDVATRLVDADTFAEPLPDVLPLEREPVSVTTDGRVAPWPTTPQPLRQSEPPSVRSMATGAIRHALGRMAASTPVPVEPASSHELSHAEPGPAVEVSPSVPDTGLTAVPVTVAQSPDVGWPPEPTAPAVGSGQTPAQPARTAGERATTSGTAVVVDGQLRAMHAPVAEPVPASADGPAFAAAETVPMPATAGPPTAAVAAAGVGAPGEEGQARETAVVRTNPEIAQPRPTMPADSERSRPTVSVAPDGRGSSTANVDAALPPDAVATPDTLVTLTREPAPLPSAPRGTNAGRVVRTVFGAPAQRETPDPARPVPVAAPFVGTLQTELVGRGSQLPQVAAGLAASQAPTPTPSDAASTPPALLEGALVGGPRGGGVNSETSDDAGGGAAKGGDRVVDDVSEQPIGVVGEPALFDPLLRHDAVGTSASMRRARTGETDDLPRVGARVTGHAAFAIAAFQAAAASAREFAGQAAVGGTTQASVMDHELPSQIVQAIRIRADNGNGLVHMRLNPGFLGDVTVDVQMNGASVVASVQAASADVRDWLRANELQLRQTLAEQGLHLEQLAVADNDAPRQRGSSDEQRRRQPDEQPPDRRSGRSREAGTFEALL